MQTSPTSSCPADAAQSAEPSYKLLMRLPDLGKPSAPGPLGRLRVNWRRRRSGASAPRWWTRRSAKWLSAAAAALIVLAALLTVLGPSPRAPNGVRVLADATQNAPQAPTAPAAQSVVPAGYQTADSVAVARSSGHVTSLLTLRPARLTGSIETVDSEVPW